MSSERENHFNISDRDPSAEATKSLIATVVNLAEENNKQAQTMIALTRCIAFLTVVMLVGLVVQICIALALPK